ncbi:hypothetical protein GALMADRAFT_161747 [Galerina marginata CBS 339.88]|uniref:Uncharacterized protein n=1 Tax=Galerina marginata (strain CBS 339.88) TaxID=685588 RepID=A0A067SK72_GALM3|nr:hypothetical protein GALMADRAFT_161747 [Galerina marginata CBS 339.88]
MGTEEMTQVLPTNSLAVRVQPALTKMLQGEGEGARVMLTLLLRLFGTNQETGDPVMMSPSLKASARSHARIRRATRQSFSSGTPPRWTMKEAAGVGWKWAVTKAKEDGGADGKRGVGNLEEDPSLEVRDGEGGAGVGAWDHADELSGYVREGAWTKIKATTTSMNKRAPTFRMDVPIVYALRARPISGMTREQSIQLQVLTNAAAARWAQVAPPLPQAGAGHANHWPSVDSFRLPLRLIVEEQHQTSMAELDSKPGILRYRSPSQALGHVLFLVLQSYCLGYMTYMDPS